jgi:hypothetical protein
MHEIGDLIMADDALQTFYGEDGPHMIIGKCGDSYIISGQNGFEIKESDIAKYGMDKKYRRMTGWIIYDNNIMRVLHGGDLLFAGRRELN